jgi:hypothetical protein
MTALRALLSTTQQKRRAKDDKQDCKYIRRYFVVVANENADLRRNGVGDVADGVRRRWIRNDVRLRQNVLFVHISCNKQNENKN